MSWWDSSNFTSLASQAIKSAQKKIDKVLDIPDEAPGTSPGATSTGSTPGSGPASAASSPKAGGEDNFWNSWFTSDAPAEEPSSSLSASASLSSMRPAAKVTKPRSARTPGERSARLSSRSVADAKKTVPGDSGSAEATTEESKAADSTPAKEVVQSTQEEPKVKEQPTVEADDTAHQLKVEISETEAVPKISEKSSPPLLTSEPPAVRKSTPLRLGSRPVGKSRQEEQKQREQELAAQQQEMELKKKQEEAAAQAQMEALLGMGYTVGEHKPEKDASQTDSKTLEYSDSIKSVDKSVSDSNVGDTNVQDSSQPLVDQGGEAGSAGKKTDEVPEPSSDGEAPGGAKDNDVSTDVATESSAAEVSEKAAIEVTSEQPEVTSEQPAGGMLRVADVVAMDASMTASAWEESELPELGDEELDLETPPDTVEVSDTLDASVTLDVGATLDVSETMDESVESGEALVKSSESNATSDELSESNRTLTADDFVDPSKTSDDNAAMADSDLSGETCSGSEQTGDSDITVKDVASSAETEDEPEEERTATPTQQPAVTTETSPESRPSDVPPPGGTEPDMVSSTLSSSSSIVKTMIEDAMSESLKEADHHSSGESSDKSSEMVRIESGHNSGHTSGDEIDTTTSSDIEIISNPTPNGENRVERPFDLSPLRHALSRTVRRGSPPGHKRSDSGSSGQSTWSKNGDDITSPESARAHKDLAGAERRSSEGKLPAAMQGHNPSEAIQSDKLLKIPEISLNPESDASPQKLAEMAEVLDAREKKMVELSRENIDLQEANSILRSQLQQSEEAREAELADVNTVTEEFTERLSEAEQRYNQVIREKEAMKKQLQQAESMLMKKADASHVTEQILGEKEEQISELMAEGEKLSKQQLQSNNIIKKLRTKEKEYESTTKTQKQKLESNKTEIEHLKKVLDSKEDLEKRQVAAIHQLNEAVKKMEMEINRLKSDLEDSSEKNRSLQVALDNSYKEIAELHKENASKQSEMHVAALSAEVSAKEELRLSMEKQTSQMRLEQEALITQIEDLRLSLTRQEKESSRREDVLRQEISDLQRRLQEAEDRNQELTQSITSATRPLLRQIENLNSTYTAQSATYEKVERNLTERLAEAQNAQAAATEKERAATEQLMEQTTRITTIESQLSGLRQEKSRLTAQLEMERSKSEVLEDAKNNEAAQHETLKHSFDKQIGDLKKEKLLLEHQLEMEKMRVETEKKKLSMAHDQLNEKDQLLQARNLRSTPSPRPASQSISRQESMDRMSESFSSQISQEEVLERTLSIASSNGTKPSLYETLRHTGAATLVENLQSQLKMREGELVQLQSEIQELERTREAMARELVNLSTQNDSLQKQLEHYPHLEKTHKELNQRYNALLQMYGEKVEETDELRLDLQDVKEMYKLQIEELLKNTR